MKKLSLTVIMCSLLLAAQSQDKQEKKNEKRAARKEKINNLIRQAEEGVLVYRKQTIAGAQLRSNGYGGFIELGRMKTNRKTNLYRLDITETMSQKELKLPNGAIVFGNPYKYGKVNNFYQVEFGFGQQHILGQKGNKNGVAVSAVYTGGLSLGLLRPYYLEVQNPMGGENLIIKYSQDTALFLGTGIVGGGGFSRGWSEMSVKPGAFVRTALRFDYGRYNELVSGLEIGVGVEYYASKIKIMAKQKDKSLFFQGYIAVLFGRRK